LIDVGCLLQEGRQNEIVLRNLTGRKLY